MDKVLELLSNSSNNGLSSFPPSKPKSGDVYLFSPAGNVKAKGKPTNLVNIADFNLYDGIILLFYRRLEM